MADNDVDIIDVGGTEIEPADQKKLLDQLGFLKPLSLRGIPPWVVYLAGLIGVGYMLNPIPGGIDIIPDIIPIVGNLDDGAAFTLIWYALVEFFEGRKYRKPPQP